MPSKNTKKKLKQNAKSQNPKVEQLTEEQVQEVSTEEVKPAEKIEVKTEKTTEQKTKKVKEKKPSKLKQKGKEVASELKKVTWPTFSQIVKKTSVVLAVVAIFAVVLLGIDKVLEIVYNLFFNTIAMD